jgi:quinoprotein relay system zinc metallohydrolase 2
MERLALIPILLLGAVFAHAEPLPVEEVAAGVYVHRGIHEEMDFGYHGDICNIGFIIGKTGVAVIDSGGNLGVGKRLLEAIRTVTALPVRYVINTHVHPDHIFGNAAFVAENPVFVGHHKLGDAMERRKEIYLRNNSAWMGAAADGSELVKPTTSVQNTLELDLGERILLLTAHPVAHTNTDLSILDRQTATLWSGDLLFIERTPSIDGDLKGWLQVMAGLRNIPAKRIVPGHGPVSLDWQAALSDQQRYLETLLNDVRASIKRGEAMERSMEHAAATEKGRWQLFDAVNRRNVNIVYPALEWE